MTQPTVEQINEEAFFVVDIAHFQQTILPYDARYSNQTIVFDWDTDQLAYPPMLSDEPEEPGESEENDTLPQTS